MIYFDNTQCYKSRLTLSMAQAIAGMLTIAGIHEHIYEQRDLYLDDGDTSGVFSRSGNIITASAAGSMLVCEAGGATLMGVTLADGSECFACVGNTVEALTHKIGVRINAPNLEVFDMGGVVSRWPITAPYALRIIFDEVTNYKLELIYKIVAVYIGDLLLTAHAIQVSSDASSQHIGITAPAGGGAFGVYIDDLGAPVRSASVDPGETVSAGLSRLIKNLPLVMFARYNGAVKFYAPKDRDAVATLSGYENAATEIERSMNFRALSGVVRAVGALPEAEYMDPDIVDLIGAQIAIASNPNISTFEGAKREARRVQDKTEEAFAPLTISGFVCPVLEPGDVFVADGDTWIHDSSDMRIGVKGVLDGRLTARMYISEA